MTKDKLSRIAIALFFLLLAGAGLCTCADYGVPYDEPTEQQILQENLHEYAYHLLGPDSEAVRWYQSQGIERISQSIQREHGESAYYPVAFLLGLLQDQPDRLMILWHAYTWLWFMAGVWALYAMCRETGLTRPVSCMGTLLLYLCPRFFAEGHYNNKDMVLLSLALLILWLGARFLRRPTLLRGVLLSLIGAVAANTKLIGLFLWGLMGLAAVIMVTRRRQWSLSMAGVAAGTIVSFLLFYALLTPALWDDAGSFLHYVVVSTSSFSRWHGDVLFRGCLFADYRNPLPWYYIPWMMVLTLPIYVLPLAAVGQLSTLRQAIRQKGQALSSPETLTLAAATLSWLVPMAYQMLSGATVYNGWRHFYFVFAGIGLMGAHGIGYVMDWLRRHTGEYGMHRLFAVGMCLFYLWMSIGIVQNHPYQYAYYNRIERAGAEQRLELDYWNVHTREMLARLLQGKPEERLEISARDGNSLAGLRTGRASLNAKDQSRLTVTENPDAPYLYANTTYAAIAGQSAPEGYRELLKVKSYGLTLGVVYARDAE